MDEKTKMLHQDAIQKLKKFGITGTQIYLIDVIPLIEMVWADGKAQDSEIAILDDYLVKHVRHINALAGYNAISIEAAKQFVSKFLEKRPDPALLKTLRSLVAPVRLSSTNEEECQKLKDSLLSVCLDIASSSVTQYPYGLSERFNQDEKQCFFEILESF